MIVHYQGNNVVLSGLTLEESENLPREPMSLNNFCQTYLRNVEKNSVCYKIQRMWANGQAAYSDCDVSRGEVIEALRELCIQCVGVQGQVCMFADESLVYIVRLPERTTLKGVNKAFRERNNYVCS